MKAIEPAWLSSIPKHPPSITQISSNPPTQYSMALSLLTKSVFNGEFPLTAQFRSGPRGDQKSYEHWKDRQILPEGHPVDFQTQILRFSPNNYEYVNRFAEENPQMLILSTWRAASGLPKGTPPFGDPLEESLLSFPGHFVLSPGSELQSSISSDDESLTVESNENMVKGPALLVEQKSNGEKIWDRYEYVLITKVVDGNKVTIKRQFNGSPEARDFPSGTYIAPLPWDDRSRTPYINFFFNLSEDCPLDEQGRSAMEVMFEDMLYPLAYGGELSNLGGLDLASGPLTATPYNADYDVDGVADPDSVYIDGVRMFYEKIREVLGPNRVITTSPDWANIDMINGVNQEGLANPDDPWEEVSRTVNDMLSWNRLAELPLASIIFSQYYDKEDEPLRIQLQRMLNGYATCLGMAADIEQAGLGEAVDAIQRVELFKGDEQEAHWLGRLLGLKRPAEYTPNLLGGASSSSEWESIIPALSVLRGDLSIDGDEMVLTPWEKEFPGYITLDLNFRLDEKADFTVILEARSEDDQFMRKIYLPRVSVPVDTGPVRGRISNQDYLPLSFYVRGAAAGEVTIDFRFEKGGPIRFRKLAVHKSPDTLACEFERGVVLVNPSLDEDVPFDLTKLFPDRQDYRRLKATPPGDLDVPDKYLPNFEQALEINNGKDISKPENVRVGQRNALFLVANDVSGPRPPTVDPLRGVDPGTMAPTIAPPSGTSVPVATSDAPTDAPAATPSVYDFSFEITEGVFVGCNWVKKKPELTESRCLRTTFDGDLVLNLCPTECANYGPGPSTSSPVQSPTEIPNEGEYFELKDGVFITCNWPTKKKTGRRCNKVTIGGSVIKDLCPEACEGH